MQESPGKVIVVLIVGIGVCVLTLMFVAMLAGMTYQSQEKVIDSIGSEGTTTTNVTNIEIFDNQIPFGEPTAAWYTFNNDPWNQVIDFPFADCDGGNMSQMYYDWSGHGNQAFGSYLFTHTGTDYTTSDFYINTTPVLADDLYYWEDFQNESPTTEGNTAPSPYDDTYDFEESASFGLLNLSAGFNATYDPSNATTNMVWWINNTGAGTDMTEWFNDTSYIDRLYEIGFDFNVTDYNDGLMDVTPGYYNYFNTTFGFQTNPNGYDYLIWENDSVAMSKNLSEFPLTGPNVWYTVRFYFDAYNSTINCTIWDTATTTLLYWMDTYDITAMPIYGDLIFTAYDASNYGNTSIKIDNYYVMGYDDTLISNAFKVVPYGTSTLMVIDNVNDTAFDVTMWNGTTSNLIYSGLNTSEWYHYWFTYHWDNSTIETTARRGSDNAWMGNAWIGMDAAVPTLNGLIFSGIDTFDCENIIDNVSSDYVSTGSTADTEIRDAVREAATGGIQGISTIGGYLPVIVLAIVIVLVLGFVFAIGTIRLKGNKPGGGAL
jgi:hypothetical protein